MIFKVYASQHLASFGPAIIIVGSTIAENDKYITECHAFFSLVHESYGFFTTSFDEKDKAEINETEVREAAKSHALDFLHSYLQGKDPLKYQAMVNTSYYVIKEVESKELLHLHMRSILSAKIEETVILNALDSELKEFISTIASLGRITTNWKNS